MAPPATRATHRLHGPRIGWYTGPRRHRRHGPRIGHCPRAPPATRATHGHPIGRENHHPPGSATGGPAAPGSRRVPAVGSCTNPSLVRFGISRLLRSSSRSASALTRGRVLNQQHALSTHIHGHGHGHGLLATAHSSLLRHGLVTDSLKLDSTLRLRIVL